MDSQFVLPERPLERFIELYAALRERKRWYDSVLPLRYSALTLATMPGSAQEVTDSILDLADRLKRAAGWFGPLNSPVRFVVAAVLYRDRRRVESFCSEVDRWRDALRAERLPRGAIYEVIAYLILQRTAAGTRTGSPDAQRFAAVFRRLREDHRFLTGADDYPACALLAGTDDAVERIGPEVEACYQQLRRKGFPIGNPLQTASHVLYFSPRPTPDAVRQFVALRDAFREAKIRIFQSDFDELAVLAFLEQDARRIVDLVVRHRRGVAEIRPRPDRSTSFSLACGTAFLELVRASQTLGTLHDATVLMQLQAVIAAQQAVAMAAAAGAASAAAASSS